MGTGYDGELGVSTEYIYSWAHDDWICLEWNTDTSTQRAALYENGKLSFSVDNWKFQGNSQSHSYKIPTDLDLRVGMYTYNGIAVSGSFKDVVVATERVGCGSSPSPPPSPTPPSPPPHPTTPSPSPAPPLPSCEFTEGFDCVGGDISHQLMGSQGECCSRCQQTDGCNAFTFSQYDASGQRNPSCYLQTGCASKVWDGSCVAGVLHKTEKLFVV